MNFFEKDSIESREERVRRCVPPELVGPFFDDLRKRINGEILLAESAREKQAFERGVRFEQVRSKALIAMDRVSAYPTKLQMNAEYGKSQHRVSVQPEWHRTLPLQQQSVLFLAARGPDGTHKHHPCKPVHVAYRATVFRAGKYGRMLEWGERADSFMSLDVFADVDLWAGAVLQFMKNWDALPFHYVKHLMHGVQILGFKHPDERFRARWGSFYQKLVEELHLAPESEEDMDDRLGDWNRKDWATLPQTEP